MNTLASRLRLFVVGLLAASAVAQAPPEPPPLEAPPTEPPKPERARVSDGPPPGLAPVAKARLATVPGHRDVVAVRPLRQDTGRVDWARQGDRLAYDRPGDDGRYDIYLAGADGEEEVCLTCDKWEFRKVNALNPVWHPSGEMLVFQAQSFPRKIQMTTWRLTLPYRGLHSELWAIRRDGRDYWRLTQLRDRGRAVVDPIFSFEGDQLVWSERMSTVDGRWGDWELRVSAFKISRGLPRLGRDKTFRPGQQAGFFTTRSFTTNDRGLYVSGAPDLGQPEIAPDLLQLDLETGRYERVTANPRQRDDLAMPAPRGDRLVWISDRGIAMPEKPRLPYRGDVWVMDGDGRRQERLTYFNEPDSPYGLGEALIDDLAFSPDGRQLVVHVVAANPAIEQALYVVELAEGFLEKRLSADDGGGG